MKIVVCVKQVVDTAMPVRLDVQTNRLPDVLNYIVNPVDENAVEAALRLKEEGGGEVVVVSAGPPRVERTLRQCLAMGAEQAIRAWHPALETGDAYVTAQVLAWAIAPLRPDVVLCGSESLDEGTGQVPPTLAEILGLPQLTRVTRLEKPGEAGLSAHTRLERGHRQVVECTLPALVSVDKTLNRPRYPSLRATLRTQKEPVPVLDAEAGGLPLERHLQFVGLAPPRPRPKKTVLMDVNLSPEERLKQIMSGGIVEKDASVWEGPPEELAKRLVRLLTSEFGQLCFSTQHGDESKT